MQLKEKMAYRYSKNHFFEHIPKQILRQDAYLAGFEYALELIIKELSIGGVVDVRDEVILKIGENEV